MLKPINFIAANEEVYGLLIHCIACDFGYEQTNEMIEKAGYVLTHKQFNAMSVVIEEQMNLDMNPATN